MAGRGLGDRWGPPAFFKKVGGWDAKYEIWGSPNFCTENWASCIFRVSQKKTIVITMTVKKEVKNFLSPPICVHCFRSLAVAFGKLSHSI